METIFTKICRELCLGTLIAEPQPLTGGLTHKMYSLWTDKGKFALKLLNPYIMRRKTAPGNYARAEELERKLEGGPIPILPALTFGGKKMQQIDGQYYYLFQWFDGKPVRGKDITPYHCAEIGKALALIHRTESIEAPFQADLLQINWDQYLGQMERENPELYQRLCDCRNLLYQMQERANLAMKKIPESLAICHSDLDSKNVLWNAGAYRIIDLECLSYGSPFLELLETGLCWSGYEDMRLDFDRLCIFIKSYANGGGSLAADWETVYSANCGALSWLEYNIKRVLGIDCSVDERAIGCTEVPYTLSRIVYYDQMKEEILSSFSRAKTLRTP